MKIICEHVSKKFTSKDNELEVLRDINVETEEHDFVCILGPNGCGKSTLLKIMAGILPPSEGAIRYAGSNDFLTPTSLIFQEHGLFPWLKVIDNICFVLEIRGLSKKERYKKAQGYMEKMGLMKFAGYYPHQLSVGMKQKVNLIRGLLTDSAVLLIDEPSVSLDIYSKLTIQEDIHKIWSEYKKTVIYITHDIEEAICLSKHIWIMSKSPSIIIKKFDTTLYRQGNAEGVCFDRRLLDLEKEVVGIIQRESARISI